ncbi:MAG: C2 family cysteine protease, partial [bacterium]
RGGHAYTLVSGFTMTDKDGIAINLFIVRDPWGTSDYNGEWNANDTRWND